MAIPLISVTPEAIESVRKNGLPQPDGFTLADGLTLQHQVDMCLDMQLAAAFTIDKRKYTIKFTNETEDSVRILIERIVDPRYTEEVLAGMK